MRRLAAIGALLFGFLTASPPADAGVAGCLAEKLPRPAGYPVPGTGWVTNADRTGRYLVGAAQGPTRSMEAVLWVEGVPRELEPDQPFASEVNDVNESGVAVGAAWAADGSRRAWRYADGAFSYLPVPAGAELPVATGINLRGDIVGYAWFPAIGQFRGLLWSHGTVRQLPSPHSAFADGISDGGVIIGRADPTGQQFTQVGYRWPDPSGEGKVLVGPEGSQRTRPEDIEGHWVAGWEQRPDGTRIGALWNIETGATLSRPGPLSSVNRDGDVAVESVNGDSAFVVRADGTTVTFAEWTNLYVIFDRGRTPSAAGYTADDQDVIPTFWSSCWPPDHS